MPAALFTGSIGVGTGIVGGVLTEPTDPSYARAPISMIAVNSGASSANKDIASFYPLATWGTLTSFAVFDFNGNTIATGTLTAAVLVAVAQGIVFLPGGLTTNNGTMPFQAGAALAANLVRWAPDPQRTVPIGALGFVQTGQPSEYPPLALRNPSSTIDDTIDISAQLAPGDVPISATMTCGDSTLTEVWCSFQGALITARSSGALAGGEYVRVLTVTTASGAVLPQSFLQATLGTGYAGTASGATGFGSMVSQNANDVDISGGAINGTVIGENDPAAGYFSTLKVDGVDITPPGHSSNGVISGGSGTLTLTFTRTFMVIGGPTVVQLPANETGVDHYVYNRRGDGTPITLLPAPGSAWNGQSINAPATNPLADQQDVLLFCRADGVCELLTG